MSQAIIWGVVGLVLLILIPATVKILPEYERGVILRLGRYIGTKGPGFFLIIPFVDMMRKADLRIITMDVPPQEVITKDNVTVRVNAVVYFRVVEPDAAILKVMDYIRATSQISQTTLRNVLGQSELDELLTQREKLNQALQQIIDEHTDPWGVKVSTVEIKEVELAEQMKRMMAAQAEAERERRAKIIHADGEFQASERLAEAGAVIAREPVTLQLRYLQTLTEIAVEKNSTLIFPLPMDLIKMFLDKDNSKKSD
jgi:regulator of protease activity HflC (stomatin/prohibitin superfamily)